MALSTGDSAQRFVQQGRDHYAAKRFKPALEQFTRAMRLCECNRGMKRERCSCKGYEKIAKEGGSIFNEAMYNCTCSVGKTFNKCDNSDHIQALDYRAATFEALQALDRAQKDAEWILELAPRLLDGYLRLGKISQLQKKREFAWQVYSAGIEVGTANNFGGSAKLKKLYDVRSRLHMHFSRHDPMKAPPEIIHEIFQYLDTVELVRCTSVCKNWRSHLLLSRDSERLWRSLLFPKSTAYRNAPSISAWRRMVSYARNNVRQINIENMPRLRLTQPKFLALVQGAKNLETLSLQGIGEQLAVPQQPGILNNLSRIYIDNTARNSPSFLVGLLQSASPALQYLHVVGLPITARGPKLVFPTLPSLRFMRLECSPSQEEALQIHQLHLQPCKSPNLEQLWLDGIDLGGSDFEFGEEPLWPKLKAMILRSIRMPELSFMNNIRRLAYESHKDSIQHIEFDEPDAGALSAPPYMMFGNGEDFDSGYVVDQYSGLYSFRVSRGVLDPSSLRQVVHDSVTAGKLRMLNLDFPLDEPSLPDGQTSVNFLHEYEWLRGASSIRHLGVSNFHFRAYPRNDDEFPLPSFLASFPNLETLEISSKFYEGPELARIVEAILKAVNLKVVYQVRVTGAPLDRIVSLAKQKGTQLFSGRMPTKWPLPIEED